MSQFISETAPVYNTGPRQGLPWLQKGLSYGQNDSGYYKRIETRGDIASVETDAQQYFAAQWEVEIKYDVGGSGAPGPGIATMVASTSWGGPGVIYSGETPISTWELDAQSTDKGLLEADFPYGIGAGSVSTLALVDPESKLAIDAALASSNPYWQPAAGAIPGLLFVNPPSGTVYIFGGVVGVPTPVVGFTYGTTVISVESADYGAAYSLYKLMAAGTTNFAIEAPIIRNTQLFSNLYSAQISYLYVRRILSAATIVNHQGAPASLIFDIASIYPPDVVPTQFIETPGDLQYGFLKGFPSLSRVSLTKYKTTTNFQFGLWPVKLFGGVL